MTKRVVSLRCLIVCILAALGASYSAFAQTTDAAIVGDVADTSGAVLPAAAVSLTDLATGQTRHTVTDDRGEWSIPSLSVGTYRLEIAHSGFKTAIHNNVLIDVAAHVKIDLQLSPGQTAETIEVSDRSGLLQTQDASVGATITGSDLARLPVNGRNYTRLILLAPGSSDRGSSQSQGTFSGTSLFSVNGQRQQDNNYTIDGVDNNFLFQNSPGMSPPMDAIQEFRILNDTSAEFGRSAGANVNLAIRSGSSHLHGTLYEYVRNNVFDANDFFNNHVGRGKLPFRQNQFGATIGGPVRLPHLYDGRKRTFFFADYEGFRALQGQLQLSNTPTAAERMGDFSALGRSLYDPFSSNPTTGLRQAFPGNRIPAFRLNASALSLLSNLQPLPNAPGLVNNLINTNPLTNNRNLWNLRLDHTLTDKDSLFFRYSFQNVHYVSPYTNTYQNSVADFNVRSFATGWLHTFTPTTLVEVKFGYNNQSLPIHDVNARVSRPDLLQQAGLRLFQTDVPFESLPIFTATGEFTYTSGTGGGGQVTEDHIYQPIVNLTQILGTHTLRAGGTVHIRHFYQTTANPMNGTLSFSSLQTQQPGVSTSGDALASFLLGVPSSYATATGSTATDGRGPYQAYYFQDDWRASSRLTSNLGLRYEYTTQPYATNDQVGTISIVPNSSGPGFIANTYWAAQNQFTGQGPQQGGFGRSLQRSNYLNFAPRVGIAYQVTPQTVVRAGFGIFYNSTFFQELMDKRKFYPYTPQLSNTVNASGVPSFLITDPSPPLAGNIGGFSQDPLKKSPYSEQWNLYLERQLSTSISLELGYFGSQNVHEAGYTFINEAVPGAGSIASRRPIPTLGDLYGGLNIFGSNYNSLRVNAVKRLSGGSQFTVNYTYGKTLTEQSSLAEINTQNAFNRAADYGRASYDIRHVFQAAYVYDAPFGRGRRFGANWNRATDAALGGWGIEGITRLESGAPMNVLLGYDNAGVGTSAQRPNLIGNPNTGGGRARTFANQPWFNVAAFAAPPSGSFGSAGQNITQGDGRESWDIAAQKSWHTIEQQNLNFRAEFFNFPNHVNFNNPPSGNLNLSSSSFGVVTSATPARQIQFVLRYNY